jgi:hypothetical protein
MPEFGSSLSGLAHDRKLTDAELVRGRDQEAEIEHRRARASSIQMARLLLYIALGKE